MQGLAGCPPFLKIEPFNDGSCDPAAPLTREKRNKLPKARSDVLGQGLLERPSGAIQPCLNSWLQWEARLCRQRSYLG